MPNPQTGPVANATPAQHDYVRARSSLSILGAFLAITRARFSTDNGDYALPWVWSESRKPDIVIELAYNRSHEKNSVFPAIFLGKTPTSWGPVTIGDRAGVNVKRAVESKMMHASTQIVAQIVARHQAEALILADIVSHAFILASDMIRDNFNVRDVFNIVEGVPTPYPQDRECWQVPVSVTVEFTERWLQQDTQNLIEQLNVYLPTGVDDPEYYRHLAITSLSS